jgi:hypothetical protein
VLLEQLLQFPRTRYPPDSPAYACDPNQNQSDDEVEEDASAGLTAHELTPERTFELALRASVDKQMFFVDAKYFERESDFLAWFREMSGYKLLQLKQVRDDNESCTKSYSKKFRVDRRLMRLVIFRLCVYRVLCRYFAACRH